MRLVHRFAAKGLCRFAVLCLAMVSAGGAWAKDYVTGASRCGPFPRVAVSTAPGLCLGLVAQDVKGMRFPRVLLEVEPGIFWLSDMGGWGARRGKLWRMNVREPRVPRFRVLDDGLDRPHGLVRDQLGRVYLGTAGAVWRYDPDARNPKVTKALVVDGLPTQGRHPLTNLAYDPAGALIINVGAPSDHCELDPDVPNKVGLPCPSSQGQSPEAALYRAVISGDRVGVPRLLAEGLRNSMALAFHPTQRLLLQAENNIDYKEADEPHEELNIITAGQHYGWPYCVENQARARHYRRRSPLDCRKTQGPVRLLPAHAAPLGLVYSGATGLSGYGQHWLVGYHGYRKTGQRIVAIKSDAQGKPSGAIEELVYDWHKRARRHPRGAPVALSMDHQGWVWIADDRNKAILVLIGQEHKETTAQDQNEGADALSPDVSQKEGLADMAVRPEWSIFVRDQLKSNCADCHADQLAGGSSETLERLVHEGWLDPYNPEQGMIYRRLFGLDGQPLMPPPKGFPVARRHAWREAILSFRLDR